jgi:hypothetical protein
MKLKFPFFLLLLCISTLVFAQTPDSIIFVPDRPGIATPPDVLSFERVQLESCLQYEHYNDGTSLNQNYHIPTVLIRLGILKYAEARVSTDYAYNIETDSGVSSPIYGMNPVTLGTKIRLFRQRSILPNTSILMNLSLPWYGKSEFCPKNLAPSINLLMSNSIFNKLSVCYNYGLIWDGNKSPVIQFYALSLCVGLFKNLSIFAEGYGYSTRYKKDRLFYDAGFAYQLFGNFQIDVSAAGQFNATNDYYFVNAGIAWQIAGKKMKF